MTDEEKDFLVMATQFGEEEIKEWFRCNPIFAFFQTAGDGL